ncbi:phosphate-starvation-inducible E [Aurantiacibacter spongiae]|uniref:Protein PsiE n=2 Tax=Aurantiacibacter spongiae TaxID=2488860 RepID=A0A3N5CYL3_9SPHN|nr:phosphate-starvation-inducible E [Aurantiacibacter spongiae]
MPPTSQANSDGSRSTRYVLGGLRVVQRAFLALVALMTILAAYQLIVQMTHTGVVVLADILLMFLFAEVIAMTAVFYNEGQATFIYPIFIAITALARLVVLQSKDMAPENIVFETSAILLLALAALLLRRSGILHSE